MTKVLKCGELMPGCPYEARGETDGEVIEQAASHAKKAHSLETTPELADQVRAAIREE
ncbi:MAG: DUF1059 domain-containing protein [Limimaricola soesokkakensis]